MSILTNQGEPEDTIDIQGTSPDKALPSIDGVKNRLKTWLRAVAIGAAALTIGAGSTAEAQQSAKKDKAVWSIGCEDSQSISIDGSMTTANPGASCDIQVLSKKVRLSANNECANTDPAQLQVNTGNINVSNVECFPYAKADGNIGKFSFKAPVTPGEHRVIVDHFGFVSPEFSLQVNQPQPQIEHTTHYNNIIIPPQSIRESKDSQQELRTGGAFTTYLNKADSHGGLINIGWAPWGRLRPVSLELGGDMSLVGTHTPISQDGLPTNFETDDKSAMTYNFSTTAGVNAVFGVAPPYFYIVPGINLGVMVNNKAEKMIDGVTIDPDSGEETGTFSARDRGISHASPVISPHLELPVTISADTGFYLNPGIKFEFMPNALTQSGNLSPSTSNGEDKGFDWNASLTLGGGFYLH